MGKLKIGWSEVDITPKDKRIRLAGQFFERISEYVETPIVATTLAIEDGAEQMIFCACDLVKIGRNLIRRVREKVAELDATIPTDKVILSAIHSHTSHVYDYEATNYAAFAGGPKGILDSFLPREKQYVAKVSDDTENVMTAREALLFLVDSISASIVEAWQNRTSGSYATGFGRAAIGMCRRVCYSDGSAKMWGDTNTAAFTELEGGNDSGIEMLFFYGADGKLTGVAASVACPAQVVEHRTFISSDYWGKVRILLREKYGEDLKVLGLCAPAGDQCPRDLIRWVNPETPIDDPNIDRPDYIERDADPSMFDINGSWKVGKRIVNEIVDALEEVTEKKDEAILKHENLTVELPLRRVTPKEYEHAVEQMEKFAARVTDHVNFADNAAMHVHTGTIMRWKQQHIQDIVPVEVHIVRLGSVAIATNPFELFLDYGNQIRARSRARQTILVQLACDGIGYLPTKKAEEGSHYSAYVSSGKVGHAGGEMLVRKTTEEINKFFAE
ncbi:MAG: hypothetical protein IKA78_02195 [Oscillospiraceae bacterium]|nr:hypothetical protein [Oscillospiraceae bacterium]